MISRKSSLLIVLFVICFMTFPMVFSVSQGFAEGAGSTRTVTFVNNCSEPIYWGVVTSMKVQKTECSTGFYAYPGGGGGRLEKGARQSIQVNLEKVCGSQLKWSGNFYARTGCNFKNGKGFCNTGDCGGIEKCPVGVGGNAPKSLAEFAFLSNDRDIYDLSLVDGFNVKMRIKPTGNYKKPRPDRFGCGDSQCLYEFKDNCRDDLKIVKGGKIVGCTSACQALSAGDAIKMANSPYCCTGRYEGPTGRQNYGNCPPTVYAKFFKDKCPDAYAWPQDDQSSTFACIASSYEVTFCP
jgi:hypothetical protein